jgi:hypothetical protein
LRFRLFFAYSGGVPHRQCRVSFTNSEGITHCAEVTAETLYEAAVLALAEFHRCGSPTRTPARSRALISRCWLRQRRTKFRPASCGHFSTATAGVPVSRH